MARARLLAATAATLSLLGASGAAAETIYLNGRTYVEAPPGSVVIAPAPQGYVVVERGPSYLTRRYGRPEIQTTYPYVVPQTTYVAPAPAYVAPTYVAPRYRSDLQTVYDVQSGYDANASAIVTTTVEPSCTIDIFGFRRCY